MRLRLWSTPIAAVLLASAAVRATAQRPSTPPTSAQDPFLWLEDVSSPRAMAWVDSQNAKTVAVLEHDPRYAALSAEAVKLAEAPDRIPVPSIIGSEYYNFWQDAAHPPGIWRRASAASYRTATPAWTTVIDLDALSKSEKANWFWKGADCLEPATPLSREPVGRG